MARHPVISDEQLLDTARQLFLEKGIRASTVEVARRAGVSEGSIFRRFPTKALLFRKAMEPVLEEPQFLRSLEACVCEGDLQQNLVDVGLEIVEFFRVILPLMMMAWSNPDSDGAHPLLNDPNPAPIRAFKRLASFFEAEIRARRLRRHDPEILARAYIGGIQNYVFFETLMKGRERMPLPAELYVRGLVDLLWVGMEPQPPGVHEPRKLPIRPVLSARKRRS
jgi:AcrR family transcriptional regulator